MIRTLRSKLVLSHIIPTILLLPLLSLYLLYTLENFYSQTLLQQLMNQAQLVRSEIEREPRLIEDDQAARQFLSQLGHITDSRIMVLNQDGTIIALSDPENLAFIGTLFEHPSIDQARRGEVATGIGQGLVAEVAYVVLPLANHPSRNILRLSYSVTDVRAQFSQLQGLVITGTVLTVILALALALGLATTITRPLRQLNGRATSIAGGNYYARVAVASNDEVGELARSFNQMTERLEEAEHARGRQLAAIVHELARPLAGMRAAIETLQDGADSDREVRESLLAGVAEELGRLERLISTLQSVHRHTIRPIQLNCTDVSIERVVRASVANFEPIAARAGITLVTLISESLPKLFADEDRLIQVLTNLLDNAFKFTPRGGQIIIQAKLENDKLSIGVADTGAGIPAKELPHIFQQFYSGDNVRSPEKRGMGLGLTICREIVTAHQGHITVESELEHGTRFTFTLPISRS